MLTIQLGEVFVVMTAQISSHITAAWYTAESMYVVLVKHLKVRNKFKEWDNMWNVRLKNLQ